MDCVLDFVSMVLLFGFGMYGTITVVVGLLNGNDM